MSTLRDGNAHLGLVVGSGGNVLDLSHHKQTVDDLAEHDVLAVEEVAGGAGHEELTAVGVGAAVRL